MYSRGKKDNYRKKIEDLIGGSQKRQRKSSSNDDVDNNIIIDVSNKKNDNITSDVDKNKTYIQRWIPGSSKVEGIHKYTNI
jgi:hypothetical protein